MLLYLFSDIPACVLLLPLLVGWLLDLVLGDPSWLPHPVVGFGKMISFGEHRLNRGSHRGLKGGLLAAGLIVLVFVAAWLLRSALLLLPFDFLHFANTQADDADAHSFPLFGIAQLFDALVIFFCLAGTTLIREVRDVFLALDRGLDEGRRQVARIVGRDTQELTAQEVRTAALETLAENLSDGVIAPLFWLLLLGTPGMLAYKMVNTLDSMIGYRTERYRQFGCAAARIDDAANYIPARLTAVLMVLAGHLLRVGRAGLFSFVRRYGRQHASPNSGYPEAALAGILNCRFGGPHHYFGQLFPKPFIGENDRELTTADMRTAVRVNRTAEVLMMILTGLSLGALFL